MDIKSAGKWEGRRSVTAVLGKASIRSKARDTAKRNLDYRPPPTYLQCLWPPELVSHFPNNFVFEK